MRQGRGFAAVQRDGRCKVWPDWAAGNALAETCVITDGHSYSATDERRPNELRLRFPAKQRRQREKARWALMQELAATWPIVQTMTAESAGPCCALKAVTHEMTRQAVTQARVEAVLGWFYAPEYWINPVCADQPIFVTEVIGGLKFPIKREPIQSPEMASFCWKEP